MHQSHGKHFFPSGTVFYLPKKPICCFHIASFPFGHQRMFDLDPSQFLMCFRLWSSKLLWNRPVLLNRSKVEKLGFFMGCIPILVNIPVSDFYKSESFQTSKRSLKFQGRIIIFILLTHGKGDLKYIFHAVQQALIKRWEAIDLHFHGRLGQGNHCLQIPWIHCIAHLCASKLITVRCWGFIIRQQRNCSWHKFNIWEANQNFATNSFKVRAGHNTWCTESTGTIKVELGYIGNVWGFPGNKASDAGEM